MTLVDTVELRVADLGDAAEMLRLIHAAFSARPPVDPPAAALSDTVADIERQLRDGHGVIAEVDGRMVGCLLVSGPRDGVCGVHRVSVLPDFRQYGVAATLVRGAADIAMDLGATHLELLSRREFPETRTWWEHHGFVVAAEEELGWTMSCVLPTELTAATADQMQRIGANLASLLRAGDLVVLNGDLGAGKTTLTQGLGAALQVEGPVISPTFVLSRVHASRSGGPALVHVDAYRLASAAELDDIDLDATLASSVTVVEWGAGIAEWLSPDRLEIEIRRSSDPDEATREVLVRPVGTRWDGVDLAALQPEEAPC